MRPRWTKGGRNAADGVGWRRARDEEQAKARRGPVGASDGERGPSGADGGGLQWRRAEFQRGLGTAADAGRAGPVVRARLGMFHGSPGPVQGGASASGVAGAADFGSRAGLRRCERSRRAAAGPGSVHGHGACGVCAFGLRAAGRQKHAEPDGAVGERAGPGESAPDHRGFRCARRAARRAVPGVGQAGPDAEAAGAGHRCHGHATARPAGAPVLSRVLPCILLPSAAGVLQRLAGADGTAHVERRCGGGRGGDDRTARGPVAEAISAGADPDPRRRDLLPRRVDDVVRGVDDVLGLPRNDRLKDRGQPLMDDLRDPVEAGSGLCTASGPRLPELRLSHARQLEPRTPRDRQGRMAAGTTGRQRGRGTGRQGRQRTGGRRGRPMRDGRRSPIQQSLRRHLAPEAQRANGLRSDVLRPGRGRKLDQGAEERSVPGPMLQRPLERQRTPAPAERTGPCPLLHDEVSAREPPGIRPCCAGSTHQRCASTCSGSRCA